MKGPGAKNDLRRILYSRGCIALFIMVLGSGFPTAYAETFEFESKTSLQSYSATIGGELSLPPGRGPFPVVILLHACGGLDPTGKASLSAHAQSLTKVGFATYILDSFSARGLTADKVCNRGGEASEFRLDDLFNAREALRKHPKIDTAKVFVVGQSHGATVALSAAVNLNKREPFRAIAAFYPSCRSVLLSVGLRSPAIVFAGAKDDWTPVSSCEQAQKNDRTSGEEFELIIYPDAYHGFDQQRRMTKYLGHVMAYDKQAAANSRIKMLEFFRRHMRDEPPGASSASSGSR